MSPRSKEKFQEIREESTEKILRAGMRVFARDGYGGATVRAIAQEAGISQGLLYNYFGSKEELLREVYVRGMKDVAVSFAEAEAGEKEPAEILTALIKASFRLVRENREFWQLSYNLRGQGAILKTLQAEIKLSAETILGKMQGLFSRLGETDPIGEALILFALIDGVSQHYVMNPENYPLAAVEQNLIEKYRAKK